ncbi:ISPpu15, transposase Orf2, partial [Pseudomonas amygdali pv. lachrymans str. M302278]
AWHAWPMYDASSWRPKKCKPQGKTGRADVALASINKLYGIERELKDVSDEQRYIGR